MCVLNWLQSGRREVAGVSATMKTIVPSYADSTEGGQKVATADDYTSLQLRMEPAKGAQDAGVWASTGVIDVRNPPNESPALCGIRKCITDTVVWVWR